MKQYWLGIRDNSNNTDVRGPFGELEGALKETRLFKPYSDYEFIVFPLRTVYRLNAIAEADRIWTTPALLEDHIVEGWAGYVGKLEYGTFKCKNCGVRCRVWKGSDSYKHHLCAKCLDEAGLGVPRIKGV